MNFSNILTKAIKLAESNSTGQGVYRHSAILYNKSGRVLSTGWNLPLYKVPIAYYFHKKGTFHAETHCLWRYKELFSNDDLYLLSIRINKNSELRLAMPCQECLKMITAYNIKKVYYSTSDGEIKSYALD